MTTKLEQVLARCLSGREIILWGNVTRELTCELARLSLHTRAHVAHSGLDPDRHYVIAVTDGDFRDFKQSAGASDFKHARDCICHENLGTELPFDWDFAGCPIGKHTYFGSAYVDALRNGYIESIGRFTSVNSTAMMHVDHQFNMTFVSDGVANLFSPDDRELFIRRLLADPKLPGTSNKSTGVTIGSDVWIGANSFINCSKVKTIGDGAVIGTGAVVLEDVPPYAIVVGAPAKIMRYRYSPAEIGTLLRVKWWDWDERDIKARARLLIYPEEFFAEFGI